MQKDQAAATMVAAASSACDLPFVGPVWRGSSHEVFRASPRGLVYGRNGSPSSAQHLGVPGSSWGSVRRVVTSQVRRTSVQCDRDLAPTEIDTQVLVLVVCFVLRPAPCSRYELLGALRRACFFAAKGSQPKSVESHKLSHKHGVRYSRRAEASGASFRGGGQYRHKD